MHKITLETLATTLEKLARMTQNGFSEITSTMAKQEDLLALVKRVDWLTERVEKLEHSTDNRFLELLGELKEIRERILEVDCRADVISLDLRVKKLEKKTWIKFD